MKIKSRPAIRRCGNNDKHSLTLRDSVSHEWAVRIVVDGSTILNLAVVARTEQYQLLAVASTPTDQNYVLTHLLRNKSSFQLQIPKSHAFIIHVHSHLYHIQRYESPLSRIMSFTVKFLRIHIHMGFFPHHGKRKHNVTYASEISCPLLTGND